MPIIPPISGPAEYRDGTYFIDRWGQQEYWNFTTSTGTLATYPLTTSSSSNTTITYHFDRGTNAFWGDGTHWYDERPRTFVQVRDGVEFIPATEDEVEEYAAEQAALGPTVGMFTPPGPYYQNPARTPEEETARAARIAARQVEVEQRRTVRATARSRSEETLLSFLDEQQRADYLATGAFDVTGSAGGRYRIRKGSSGNVVYLDPVTHLRIGTLCAHPSMNEQWLPDPDVALAQMLALMTDEPNFCGIANVHWGVRPPCADMTARQRLVQSWHNGAMAA